MILINKVNREIGCIDKCKKDKDDDKSVIKSKKKNEQNGDKRFVILSKYNIFFKNMQPFIMEMYPEIKNKERMVKIGIEWRKHNVIISKLKDKYVEEIKWVLKELD